MRENYTILNNSFKKLNNSFKKKAIFRLGIEAGFFSEYNNMVLAMLYCLEHHIQFKLCSNQANFDRENGWNGFFEPFCEEVIDTHKHFRSVNWKYALKRLVRGDFPAVHSLYPYFTFWKRLLYTQDIFGKSRNVSFKKHYDIPELQIKGDIRIACSQLIKLTWRYNSSTQQKVNNYRQSVCLPSSYIGMHIRGGDKFMEAELQHADVYMDKALSLTNIKHAFILTDDYSIFENLQTRYTDWTFYTLCDLNQRGYFHGQFMEEQAEEIRERMIKLFTSMDIIADASLFIGTYSSNPGMYQGMRMPAEKTFAIDFPSWKIW